MDLREECNKELRRIYIESHGIDGAENIATAVIVAFISEAFTAIVYFEQYGGGGGNLDKLIQVCKRTLSVAKMEAKTGKEVHALWLLRLAIRSFLNKEEASPATGIT